MRRIVFCGLLFVLFLGFVLGGQMESSSEQRRDSARTASSKESRRAAADSTDDAQQAVNGGAVFASADYVELMLDWFQKSWEGAVRFPNSTVPRGS